jgi:hypothetical protein
VRLPLNFYYDLKIDLRARREKREWVLLFSSSLPIFAIYGAQGMLLYEEASSQYARLNFLPVTQRFENLQRSTAP